MKRKYWWDEFKSRIPEGKSGDWAVQKFTVSKQDADFHNLRCSINRTPPLRIEPGNYTRLVRGNDTIMSDTPAEIYDHMKLARGYGGPEGIVLVLGLGLGVAVSILKRNKAVTKIIVVEKSDDVLALTGPHIKGKNVKIIKGDAFTFHPYNDGALKVGEKLGYVWHDIWDTISPDNLTEMARLKKRYFRWLSGGGSLNIRQKQGCWSQELLRQVRR